MTTFIVTMFFLGFIWFIIKDIEGPNNNGNSATI